MAMNLKVLAAIFMTFFFFSGLILFAIGLWLFIDVKYWVFSVTFCTWYESSRFYIVSGLFSIPLSCFGIFTLIKGGKNCAFVFIVWLVLILLTTLAGSIYSLTCSIKLPKSNVPDDGLVSMLNAYENITYYAQSIDSIQRKLQCCGWNLYIDWQRTPFFKNTQSYPLSCCLNYQNVDKCTMDNNFNNKGCYSLFMFYSTIYMYAITIVGLLCSLLEGSLLVIMIIYLRSLGPWNYGPIF